LNLAEVIRISSLCGALVLSPALSFARADSDSSRGTAAESGGDSSPAVSGSHEDSSPGEISEERFEEIFREFEDQALEVREDSEKDEVILAEAEEIAAVADEMHEEGDLETAISLLEEAIVLLESARE
jgi:hypothetical protein